MYSNNGVVDNRSKTNVRVIDNRSPCLVIRTLHALVSSRTFCKLIIARDSYLVYRNLKDFRPKQCKLEENRPFFR